MYLLIHHFTVQNLEGIQMNVLMEREDGIADGGVVGQAEVFMRRPRGRGWMTVPIGENEANSDPCWISLMRQKAHLKLDQKGTEAAAATVIGIADKSMPQQMVTFHANRPFFYIISEQSTGSIFFIGQYMGEGNKTGISQMVKESSTTENPAIYDLQGRRIQGEPQKGFYIQNGKKILK